MTISNGALALIAGVGVLAYVGSRNSPTAIVARQQLMTTRYQQQNRSQLYRAGGNVLSNIANSIFGGGGQGGRGQSYGGNSYSQASNYLPASNTYSGSNYTPTQYASNNYSYGTNAYGASQYA